MRRRILFVSRGHTGIVDADGTGLRFLRFGVPGQVSWQPGPILSGGRRLVLFSCEAGKTWEGKVRTHLWLYDLKTGGLTEIADRNRPADFMPCAGVVPGEARIIVTPVIDGEQRVMTMNLDGSDRAEVTRAGEGFTYGVSLSPDGRRLTFHATNIPGQPGYQIFVTDLEGRGRVRVAGHPDHLYFGPVWSPDGERLLYQDCLHRTDPGHNGSDLCLGLPDGTGHRAVTEGQRHWFGTSYGTPETRGGGSNMPQWSPDGSVFTYTRTRPGSRTAWPFQAHRPDTDHFNRDYAPEGARGGTEVCLVDPDGGKETAITPYEPHLWHFRAEWSPDGGQIAHCRARVGAPSEMWVMDADGGDPRFLTRDLDNAGADHPRWVVSET